MYKHSFVHYLTKILVDIMFFGGIVCCAALPFMLPLIKRYFGYADTRSVPLLLMIVLMTSGLCAVYILWQLKTIFKTLLGGNPFVLENVGCLRKCSVMSFAISVIYIVKLTLWFSIASSIIVAVFALLGLFSLTLKDLFKQAVAYKEENDWTV